MSENDVEIRITFTGEKTKFIGDVLTTLTDAGIEYQIDNFQIEDLKDKKLHEYLNSSTIKDAEYCAFFITKELEGQPNPKILASSEINAPYINKSNHIIPISLEGSINNLERQLDATSKSSQEVSEYLIKLVQDRVKVIPKSIVHDLVFITGLSTAGKDSLLSYANEIYLKDRAVSYLTKVTTRNSKGLENVETNDSKKPIPYFTERIPINEIEDKTKYIGTYRKYGNKYAFARNELLEVLEFNHNDAVVGIYSGIKNLNNFKKEIDHIVFEAAKSIPEHVQLKTHWILIDCPPQHCKRRLNSRDLSQDESKIKKKQITQDYNSLRSLKEKEFFDFIIVNSDNTSFQTASSALIQAFDAMDIDENEDI